MKKIVLYMSIPLILLNLSACNSSGKVVTGVVVGAIVGGAVGAVVVGSMVTEQPIKFSEIKQDEVLKIEFKDREFIEYQITETTRIKRIVSQIKQSTLVESVQGDFYQTVELALTDDRVVRIGVNDSYLKNGNAYYKMGKELNEEIKKHF